MTRAECCVTTDLSVACAGLVLSSPGARACRHHVNMTLCDSVLDQRAAGTDRSEQERCGLPSHEVRPRTTHGQVFAASQGPQDPGRHDCPLIHRRTEEHRTSDARQLRKTPDETAPRETGGGSSSSRRTSGEVVISGKPPCGIAAHALRHPVTLPGAPEKVVVRALSPLSADGGDSRNLAKV